MSQSQDGRDDFPGNLSRLVERPLNDENVLLQEMIDNYRMSMDALKPACPVCGRICSNPGNLKQHMKNMHGPPDQWETCHICEKQCKSRQYLLQHLLQTHGIRQRSRFMTDICKI